MPEILSDYSLAPDDLFTSDIFHRMRFNVPVPILFRMCNGALLCYFERAIVHVGDGDIRIVDFRFGSEAEDRTTRCSLCGCATNVFPVESDRLSQLMQEHPCENSPSEMGTKLYWPEEARESEPDILRKVQGIAEDYPDNVKGHIPDTMVWFHKLNETPTANNAVTAHDAER
ncbi:hypothetical protein AZE42_07626 [Rhizopogon vesiculosus]|uniref:Fungal-type protein kinase domain-containing protein n=1 Tax=Rhizopogon vesiculosus TaxID=180088 RepID=A0A1J8QM08_9AGAM|nr:hypothetical protein AZE42_07626 [Rhizopogon vesiculosus]